MRNKSVQILVESGAMVALAVLFDFLKIYQLPNGGSVTLGSMVPIMFLAWRRGVRVGVAAGCVFGFIGFIIKPYYLHWIQFFVDYLLAFGVIGIVGFWRQKQSTVSIAIAVIFAGTLRYLVHVASGVLFWMEGLDTTAAIIGSLQYNATYMVPEIIISVVVMTVLIRRKWNVK